MTNGCSFSGLCDVVTLFGFGPPCIVVGVGASNSFLEDSDLVLVGYSFPVTLASQPFASFNYAVWETIKVSSPNVAIIMVMGIAGLLVSQRRRQV